MTALRPASVIQLWPLPLLAAAFMLAGGTIAAYVSMRLELIPVCNPLLDGCVSISRAGRHGLANIIFRGFIFPSAVLQALVWFLCGRWLCSLPICSAMPRFRWLPWLGVPAGVFLCLYASFLGTEGDAYRWLRQYGTVFYFGLSFVCMLILHSGVRNLPNAPRSLTTAALPPLFGVMLILGLANTLLAQVFEDPLKDRIENITEWWLGIGYVTVFVLLAETWRRMRVSLSWPNG